MSEHLYVHPTASRSQPPCPTNLVAEALEEGCGGLLESILDRSGASTCSQKLIKICATWAPEAIFLRSEGRPGPKSKQRPKSDPTRPPNVSFALNFDWFWHRFLIEFSLILGCGGLLGVMLASKMLQTLISNFELFFIVFFTDFVKQIIESLFSTTVTNQY